MFDSGQDYKVTGYNNISRGIFLVVPNKLTCEQLITLTKNIKNRRVRFLVDEAYWLDHKINEFLNEGEVEALVFSSLKEKVSKISSALKSDLKDGDLLVFVPSKVVATKGTTFSIPKKQINFLLDLDLDTVPLFTIDNTDFSLSVEHDKNSNFNLPKISHFSFGPVLTKPIKYSLFQESMLLASQSSVAEIKSLDTNLAYAVIQGLKTHGKNAWVYDGLLERKLSFDQILTASMFLSQIIREKSLKKRIGIALPPSIGALIANVAVLISSKIPVNLNFTSSKESINSSIKQSEIDHIITSNSFKQKFPDLPWLPDNKLIFIEKEMAKSKMSKLFLHIANKLRSANSIADKLGIDKEAGHKEAVLLFTSGSSGNPKGVPLTHRNIITNVKQITNRLGFHRDQNILGCLPFFHSFGSTVTLWYPLIEGINLVTYPSPLEVKRVSKLLEKFKIVLLVTTPTFLRNFMRKSSKEQFAPLKLVVTGAEKLPPELAKKFKEQFDKDIMEGYGLTETSPVTNVNLPNPVGILSDKSPIIESSKPGSVGQFLTGIALQITHPETGKPQPLERDGIIWLKGDNIFRGYLNNKALNEKTLKDGWFKTGDIGYLDEDGFLFIKGRQSRFSKIGGEMVPHQTVEDTLLKAFHIDESIEKQLLIIGEQTKDGRESLALLLHKDIKSITLDNIRKNFTEKKIPNLWAPKRIVHVDYIPQLASGKIDMQACQKLITKDEKKIETNSDKEKLITEDEKKIETNSNKDNDTTIGPKPLPKSNREETKETEKDKKPLETSTNKKSSGDDKPEKINSTGNNKNKKKGKNKAKKK